MGVQLNIKDETVIRLAKQLAEAERKTVTQALRDLLEREHQKREETVQAKLAAVEELVKEAQKHWSPEARAMTLKELMDSVYDEHGLPA